MNTSSTVPNEQPNKPSNKPPNTPPTKRTAVIVVHGVADQARGETAAAVALQLAHARGGSVRRCEWPIDVPRLQPASGFKRWHAQSLPERMSKSLRQSVRSDFLADDLGGKPVAGAKAAALPNSARGAPMPGQQPADEGVRYTDYLLAKARGVRSDDPPPVYQMPCFEVHGKGAGRTDVFEMYWADLSRLSSNAPRVVTEFFTLLFHLSKLGADAVGLAAKVNPSNGPLQALSFFQRSADWLFSRWLALLALQLVVCSLLALPRGVLAGGALGVLAACVLALLGVVAAAVSVYRGKGSWRAAVWRCIVPGVAAAVALFLFVGRQWPAGVPWVMAAWLLIVVALHDAVLRFCELRFKAVLGIGRLLLAATLAMVLSGGQLYGLQNWDGWARGVLVAVEGLLLGQVAVWMLITPAIVGMVIAGTLAVQHARARASDASETVVRQAVVTGRVGLFLSMGIFLAFTMTAWTLLAGPLASLAERLYYTPWWFGQTAIPATEFIDQRLRNSTEDFAPMALALLVLLGFVGLSFLPSLLIETRAVGGLASARLGRWLTLGYRALERLVCGWSWVVMPMLVVAAGVIAVSQWQLWAEHQSCTPEERAAAPTGECVAPLTLRVRAYTEPVSRAWLPAQNASSHALAWLVVGISGGAASLIAIGGMAFKKIRALRAPLDAALDVDNHFREFPRHAISRVQIFERYVALLRGVLAAGFTDIVIVSHSQGTVITADLLRYLQQRERLLQPGQAAQDELVALGRQLKGHVSLVTAGCPLRQLYALRFPVMYGWVLEVADEHRGPSPAALGVARWANLWGSGDYVGRWLWAGADETQPHALQFPEEAYDDAARAIGGWSDQCIGADAHTHYFGLEQAAVTRAIVAMVDG
jgi:hypothetical protein